MLTLLEEGDCARIAKNSAQSSELIIYEGVHRIKDERSNRRLIGKSRTVGHGLAGEFPKNGEQEGFGLARSGSRHDKDVLALDEDLPDGIGLVFVRRVVEQFFKTSLGAR